MPAPHYTLTYSRIEGTANQAHIQLGDRHTNGGVSTFLCGGGKPVCPTREGTVSGVIVATDIFGPSTQGIEIGPGAFDELVRAMRAGVTYANVRTTPRWLSGEIRGQISIDNDHDDDDDDN